MPTPEATRCCICHDERRYGPLADRIYVEPTSGEDSSPQYIRGWMCEECAIVHWAWEVDHWAWEVDANPERETNT